MDELDGIGGGDATNEDLVEEEARSGVKVRVEAPVPQICVTKWVHCPCCIVKRVSARRMSGLEGVTRSSGSSLFQGAA